jgi:hypothetical protein
VCRLPIVSVPPLPRRASIPPHLSFDTILFDCVFVFFRDISKGRRRPPINTVHRERESPRSRDATEREIDHTSLSPMISSSLLTIFEGQLKAEQAPHNSASTNLGTKALAKMALNAWEHSDPPRLHCGSAALSKTLHTHRLNISSCRAAPRHATWTPRKRSVGTSPLPTR